MSCAIIIKEVWKFESRRSIGTQLTFWQYLRENKWCISKMCFLSNEFCSPQYKILIPIERRNIKTRESGNYRHIYNYSAWSAFNGGMLLETLFLNIPRKTLSKYPFAIIGTLSNYIASLNNIKNILIQSLLKHATKRKTISFWLLYSFTIIFAIIILQLVVEIYYYYMLRLYFCKLSRDFVI